MISQIFRLLKSLTSGKIKRIEWRPKWYRISSEGLSITTFPRIEILSIYLNMKPHWDIHGISIGEVEDDFSNSEHNTDTDFL